MGTVKISGTNVSGAALEITPQMIEAGAAVVADYDPDWPNPNRCFLEALRNALREGHIPYKVSDLACLGIQQTGQ